MHKYSFLCWEYLKGLPLQETNQLDCFIDAKIFFVLGYLKVLPLAHTSGSNRDEVQLVNPQGVNLKAYETKLEEAIGLYTR